MSRPEDWWLSLYDDLVAEVFLVRKSPGERAATVAFLVERLGLASGARLFDQCCGTGDLAIPIARHGARVVGVDANADYVARARRLAGGLPCEFHAGDAFTFVPGEPCDAAFNWATGWGNADDDRNRDMLRRAFEGLRPGGRFALDYQNVPRVLRDFRPVLLYRHSGPDGETLIVRESAIDAPAGLLRQWWMFLAPDGRRSVRESEVRLHLPHVVADMLREVGFADVTFHGGVHGEPLSGDSPRCVLVCRRPE